MKGLLIKDLRTIRKTGVVIFAAVAIVLAIALVSPLVGGMGSEFAVTMLGVAAGILGIMPCVLMLGTFSVDDTAHWNSFALALPVTPLAIVGSKYLLTLIFTLIGTAVVGAIYGGIALLGNIPMDINLLYVLAVASGLGLLGSAILFPVFYKWGAEKGRMIFVALCFLPMLIGFGANWFFGGISIPHDIIWTGLQLAPAIALLLLVLSLNLSYNIFRKKAF